MAQNWLAQRPLHVLALDPFAIPISLWKLQYLCSGRLDNHMKTVF